MKKVILSLLTFTALSVGVSLAQTVSEKVNPDLAVKNGSRAGNCDHEIKYHKDIAVVSGPGELTANYYSMIFIDTDELAFFGDSSYLQGVNFYIEWYEINGTDTTFRFDSCFVEIYIGAEVNGTGEDATLSEGTMIYSKYIANPYGTMNHELDSLILINGDTNYVVAIRTTNASNPAMGADAGGAANYKVDKGGWSKYGSGGTPSQGIRNWVLSVCIDGSLITPTNNLTLINSTSTMESYEVINPKQAIARGIYFATELENNGTGTGTGLKVSVNVQPENSTEEVDVGTLNSGNSSVVNFTNAFLPVTTGSIHTVEFSVSANDSVDAYKSDNVSYLNPFLVDDTRYGRVERAYIRQDPYASTFTDIFQGNVMDLYADDTVGSMDVHLFTPTDGAEFYGFMIGWDSIQKAPFGDTLKTDTFLVGPDISANGDSLVSISFKQNYPVEAGKYIVGICELQGGDTWAGLATASRNYVTETAFWTLESSGSWVGEWFENSGQSYYPVTLNFKTLDRTGVTENQRNHQLRVYPNPASDIVYVRFQEGFNPTTVRMYDVVGNEVKNMDVNGIRKTTMNISELPKGIYFIEASDNKHKQIKKIFVN